MDKRNHLVKSKKPYQDYHFRCWIPKDLDKFFLQKEFRVSLKGYSYSQCKIISNKLHYNAIQIFNKIREGQMNEITLHEVKNILRDKVKQTIKHINHYDSDTNKYDEEVLNERIHQSSEKEKILKERLKSNYKETVGKIEKEIDKILNSKNIKTDKKNVDYKGLVRKWTDLKLIRENWKKELLEGQGRYEKEYLTELEDNWKIGLLEKETTRTPIIQTPVLEPIVNNESMVTSPLFSEMYPKHIQRMRDNQRREDTICETIQTYKGVIELLGDKPISQYTILDGRDYRNSLLKTPKNWKKKKHYKDFTIHQVLSMDIPNDEIMSFKRQTQLISRMTTCWNFLIDEFPEYVRENVFKTKSLRVNPIKNKDRRECFTDDDLRLVFNPKTYLPAIFDNPTGRKTTIQNPYYWIPILAILTGCRLEELCMMRCKDIMKVNGVWLYRIREEGEYGKEETRVKNHYSERDIPLHSVLRDTLDFVGYVNRMKKSGHARVFHELPKKYGIYQKNVSRFFNIKYLKKIGLKSNGRSLCMHSTRHSVETHLTNQNVNPRYIDFLQGHSQKGTGGNTYMKGIKPEVLLKECVDKIQFEIDWEKLKVKW